MNKKDLNRTELFTSETGHEVIMGVVNHNRKVTPLQKFYTKEFINTMVQFLHARTNGGLNPLVLLGEDGNPAIVITARPHEEAQPVVGKANTPTRSNIVDV